MVYNSTLTKKWQMTLPKDVRRQLGLRRPGKVSVEVVKGRQGLIKIKKVPDLLSLAGTFKVKGTTDALKEREYFEKNYTRL